MQEMQETWVQSLGWEDSPEEEMTTHSSILACEIPYPTGRQKYLGDYSPWRREQSDMTERVHTHLLLTSCVIVGRLLNLFESHYFPYL